MLQRQLGPQATQALVTFGEVLDGPEAQRCGMAWRCVPDGELLEEAQTMAARAAQASPELVRRVQETIAAMPDVTDHGAAVELELEAQLWSMEQPSFAEGLAAARSPRP
jgi:enoyl-CoA hydratase